MKLKKIGQRICEINPDVYHGNNVVYLNINVTIIVRRA